MDELIDKVADKALNIAIPLLDLFFSGMQNKLMEKRIDNAVKTIELIKSRLSEYGVKVDYEKYFTEKLQVPLELVRAISDVESDDQRELLQNLFMRHLMGKYDDDGFYPSFINIIKELTSEDIQVLMSINEEEDKDYLDSILKESDPIIKLDDDQRRVVLTDEDYCLVVAGAGAGKTTTVAAKVRYLVEKQGVDPKQILVISFTNKAVNELRERIIWAMNNNKELCIKGKALQQRTAASFEVRSLNRMFYETLIEDIMTGQYDNLKTDMTSYGKQKD